MSPRNYTDTMEGVGGLKGRQKRRELLTETQGLDVALGVGDLWTVTNAIQAPGNGYLRKTSDAETDIIVSKGEISCASGSSSRPLCCYRSLALALFLSVWSICACAEPPAVKPQWPI